MKTQIKVALLSVGATLSLAACAGSGFVPASQAPRPYTAAHDIIDGQCRDHGNIVRCPQESGGVEDAGGVQATEIR